jgi:uncharacterized protein (TIGR00369 family)
MPRPETPLPDDVVEMFNGRLGGFNRLIGLRFTSVSYDEIVAEVPVTPDLHQPYGLVHGGVYAAMIETLASVGAAVNCMPFGQTTVGLENSTSFVRAVRDGTLTGRATPLTRGRRTHVWEVVIEGDDGRLAAKGRVRMLCMEGGAEVAGEKVAIKST